MPEPFKPHHMFHPHQAPVLVTSLDQQQKLGPGWSATYVHQPYPKVLFKLAGQQPDGTPKILEKKVDSAEAEKALGPGWGDDPETLEEVPTAPTKKAKPVAADV